MQVLAKDRVITLVILKAEKSLKDVKYLKSELWLTDGLVDSYDEGDHSLPFVLSLK